MDITRRTFLKGSSALVAALALAPLATLEKLPIPVGMKERAIASKLGTLTVPKGLAGMYLVQATIKFAGPGPHHATVLQNGERAGIVHTSSLYAGDEVLMSQLLYAKDRDTFEIVASQPDASRRMAVVRLDTAQPNFMSTEVST